MIFKRKLDSAIYNTQEMKPPVCNISDVFDSTRIPDDSPLTKEFLERFARNDTYGIPYPENREGYFGNDHFLYWYSGARDYGNCMNRIRTISPDYNPKKILDLGGASGRVARHFLHEPEVKIMIMDLNNEHIKWVRKYFKGKIFAAQNSTAHHIPVEDNSLDLVLAFSVFTHIDYHDEMLLLELRRILRPGGFLYLTYHSETTWNEHRGTYLETLLSHYEIYKSLNKSNLKDFQTKEKIIFRNDDSQNPYDCQIFHSERYVDDVWIPAFSQSKKYPKGADMQSVLILQK